MALSIFHLVIRCLMYALNFVEEIDHMAFNVVIGTCELVLSMHVMLLKKLISL